MTTDEMIAALEKIVAELDERLHIIPEDEEYNYAQMYIAIDHLDEILHFLKELDE